MDMNRESAMEGIWFGMICSLILWAIIILLGMSLNGCARGGRVYLGYENQDTVKYETTMQNKSFWDSWFGDSKESK